MATGNGKSFGKIVLPMIVLILGLVLLVLNIVMEDEPGAVPLAVTLAGATWILIQRLKARKKNLHNQNRH